MSTPVRALTLAVLLSVAPVTVGVLVADPAPEAAAPPYTGTPLSDLDTSTVALARAAFCDRIPDEAVAAALDTTDEAGVSAYANGDSSKVTGSREVMHEYGCRYTGGKAVAQAWLFAPPVTEERARTLVGAAADDKGCRRVRDAPAYGDPSVAVICSGKRPSLTFSGLFGDAWLTCRLRAAAGTTEQELLDRAGRWCVAVARAAQASPA